MLENLKFLLSETKMFDVFNFSSKVRADGHGCAEILKGVLELLPLDTYTKSPVMLMDPTPEDKERGIKTPIWDQYKELVNQSESRDVSVSLIERFEFYKRAERAFAVVATGETALYGNIILKKGVL